MSGSGLITPAPRKTYKVEDLLETEEQVSRAPDAEAYSIASRQQIAEQFAAIRERAQGKKVVVVQGLGFVGSAVAAVIASAVDAEGNPAWFVIGVDLPSPAGWWKIARLNEGRAPVTSPDPDFERLVDRGVHKTRNLCATAAEEAYALADVIVIDVHLDVIDRRVTTGTEIQLNIKAFENAIRTVGRSMRADALVLVETTVPIGACEKVVRPALAQERARRGIQQPVLLAHAYERVMPGPRYIASIKQFWRSFSGIDAASAERAREFLQSFTDFSEFPPWRLSDTTSSELGKLLENSYRAMNIGFIHEWTLFAERTGVNLWEVVDSIRVRKGTHDNMRYPGFGVGGYCLTKDSLLAQWSASTLFETDVKLEMTLSALRINHDMPLHALGLVRELARGSISGLHILVAGIAYVPDVVDTRNSPAEVLVDAAIEEEATVAAHDPCVAVWEDRPSVQVYGDWREAVEGADAIVLAVAHGTYKKLRASDFPKKLLIVDASNVLNDELAKELHANGCRVLGVGKGHWRRMGLHEA
jgi:nucleotide sugar dehydrogenase